MAGRHLLAWGMDHALATAIMAALVSGCGSTGTSRVQNHPTTAAPHTVDPAMTPPPPSQMPRHEVALTADVPVALSNGVTLTLVTVLDAHVTDRNGTSGNEFTCVLKVSKGHEIKDVTLTRLTTLAGPTGTRQEVLGTQLSLVMVDAYHQPATANLLVEP